MVIDGQQISKELLGELQKKIGEKGLNLHLAAVLVGDDSEFKKFVELKGKAAEGIGLSFTTYKFPKDIGTDELKNNMQKICQWSDGVLVELPMPKHIDQQAILNEIPTDKDVDVLSDEAQKLFYENSSKINPPAVEALKIVLEINDIALKRKKAAVFGQGVLIGKPISHWLEQQGVQVHRIRSTTKDPEKLSLESDIVIAGVGKPGLITGDMVKEGAIVIDYGYGKKENKMTGDVDFIAVSKKSPLITPVPGGMGPILIAAVLKNLITLNDR